MLKNKIPVVASLFAVAEAGFVVPVVVTLVDHHHLLDYKLGG